MDRPPAWGRCRQSRRSSRTEGRAMRFLGYTLADPAIPVPPPTQEEMAKMGAFIEEAVKAGVLLATGGLGPLEEAVKVTYHNGEFTVLDGPFTEAKELVGGWALLECRDMARRVLAALDPTLGTGEPLTITALARRAGVSRRFDLRPPRAGRARARRGRRPVQLRRPHPPRQRRAPACLAGVPGGDPPAPRRPPDHPAVPRASGTPRPGSRRRRGSHARKGRPLSASARRHNRVAVRARLRAAGRMPGAHIGGSGREVRPNVRHEA